MSKAIIDSAVEVRDITPQDHNWFPEDYEEQFKSFQAHVQALLDAHIASGRKLFTTDATKKHPQETLFDLYLSKLPMGARQYHRCSCCQHFINHYGSLAVIEDDGTTRSAMWVHSTRDTHTFFDAAISALQQRVEAAKVTGIFVAEHQSLGWHESYGTNWTHIAATVPHSFVNYSPDVTHKQKMAEYRVEFKMMQQTMKEYTLPMAEMAVSILKTERMYRSEKIMGPAQWYLNLLLSQRKGQRRNKLLWLALANAHEGWAHLRNNVLGSLMDDIKAMKSFKEVKANFDFKMHPERYQRATEAPKAGNIVAAEKKVAAMGIAPSLERRFATMDDILQTIWKRSPLKRVDDGSVFGHLKGQHVKVSPTMSLPEVTMTWAKFRRSVLPMAHVLEAYVPSGSLNLVGLLTAVHADAPPIILWDRADQRNPVSWYMYHGGATAEDFNLQSGTYVVVNAITPAPHEWTGDHTQFRKAAIFLLEGCRDVRWDSGLCLFPEIISGIHSIRSTIEAHSDSREPEGGDNEANVAGLHLSSVTPATIHLRVIANGIVSKYAIDRWE